MSNKSKRKQGQPAGARVYVHPITLMKVETHLNDISGTMLALAAWGKVSGSGINGDLEELMKQKLQVNAKIERELRFTQPVATLALAHWDETMAGMRERVVGTSTYEPDQSMREMQLIGGDDAGPSLGDVQPYALDQAKALHDQHNDAEKMALAAIGKASGTAGWPEGFTAWFEMDVMDRNVYIVYVQSPDQSKEPAKVRFSLGTDYEKLVDAIYELAIRLEHETPDLSLQEGQGAQQ